MKKLSEEILVLEPEKKNLIKSLDKCSSKRLNQSF